MTLHEITARLSAAGVDSPRFDALELIVHLEKISRAAALTGGNFENQDLDRAVQRRCEREPLAYILGQWDFMGHTFRLSPECLIPRSDTELLCSLLIRSLPAGGRFADLCTGSGCIAVSALLARVDAAGAAVELYPGTLTVADFDWIVSNPPYVTMEEMESISPEVSLEPARALTDGGDGLTFYRCIFDRYPKYLRDGGAIAVEIGWQQADAVCEIARAAGMEPTVLQDLEGSDRVVCARK